MLLRLIRVLSQISLFCTVALCYPSSVLITSLHLRLSLPPWVFRSSNSSFVRVSMCPFWRFVRQPSSVYSKLPSPCRGCGLLAPSRTFKHCCSSYRGYEHYGFEYEIVVWRPCAFQKFQTCLLKCLYFSCIILFGSVFRLLKKIRLGRNYEIKLNSPFSLWHSQCVRVEICGQTDTPASFNR